MAELNDLKVNGDLEITGTLTAQNAVVTGLDGLTATVSELNFMDGVTSNVQTQLNRKASSSHTHSNYATSDHTHSGYAASSHTHSTMGSSSDYNQIWNEIMLKAKHRNDIFEYLNLQIHPMNVP